MARRLGERQGKETGNEGRKEKGEGIAERTYKWMKSGIRIGMGSAQCRKGLGNLKYMIIHTEYSIDHAMS